MLPAFSSFAVGVRAWREELLAYFDEPTTDGYAEGVINKVKVIMRRAYGLPTFDASVVGGMQLTGSARGKTKSSTPMNRREPTSQAAEVGDRSGGADTHAPARPAIGVAALPLGARVEIEAVAVIEA